MFIPHFIQPLTDPNAIKMTLCKSDVTMDIGVERTVCVSMGSPEGETLSMAVQRTFTFTTER